MTNVYVLTNDSTRNFGFDPVDDDTAIKNRDAYWNAEFNSDSEARGRIVEFWKPIHLKSRSKKTMEKGDIFFSEISTFSYKHVVSSKAKFVFEKEFPGEALFLPVNVNGEENNFWVLWVTNILDAIDESKSDIVLVHGGYKRIGWRVYKDALLCELGMFRLPMIYTAESDLVTEKFKTVVNDYGLKNFSFWDKTNKKTNKFGDTHSISPVL